MVPTMNRACSAKFHFAEAHSCNMLYGKSRKITIIIYIYIFKKNIYICITAEDDYLILRKYNLLIQFIC